MSSATQKLKYMRWKNIIKKSGLFDKHFYLTTYSDVRHNDLDPIIHYIFFGAKEGRNPNSWFDTLFYSKKYNDININKINPFVHFILYGKKEGRTTHADISEKKETTTNINANNKSSNTSNKTISEWIFTSINNTYFNFIFNQNNTKSAKYIAFEKKELIQTDIKLIAFYLPQFHPIPENNKAWGKGFTEWTNVSKAIPQYEGHYQPRLPGELGFYDLRSLSTQKRQIELAKNYGLHGFCYHYYWFDGKKVMDTPLQQVLNDPELDFPFCINWANENWTKRWDGRDNDIILTQNHSAKDDLAFIEAIKPLLTDKRYIRIKGKALLMIYRPELFPDIKATVKLWREHAKKIGIGELYLVLSHSFEHTNPYSINFDAAVEFAPNTFPSTNITKNRKAYNPHYKGTIFDYDDLINFSSNYQDPNYIKFRSCCPSWDNEARKPGKGVSFDNASPEKFNHWLRQLIRFTSEHRREEEKYIFINAWNEWAEGAYLEPDRKFGYAYLEAIYDAQKSHEGASLISQNPILIVSHDAHFHGAQMLTLAIIRYLKEYFHMNIVLILAGDGELIKEFEKYAELHKFYEYSEQKKHEVVSSLFNLGYHKAICNTSVVGDIVELLKNHAFKVISLIHELPELIKEYHLESSIEKISKYADKVIFPANYVANKFLTLVDVNPQKILIRPQGIYNQNSFANEKERARKLLREKYALPANAFIFLNVAYGDERKGMDLFFKTAIKILKHTPSAYFIWVGHYKQTLVDNAMSEIKKYGIEDHFILPGKQSAIDLFYSGADILLFPSREDPFPAVVLDALQAKLPILAFEDTGGFCELISEYQCGILCKKFDTDALSSSANMLINNQKMYQKMAYSADRASKKEFYFIDYIHDLLDVLDIFKPKISVIVPNYNYEKHIRERLESIINQTYPPYEIIFLDDCSTDNSVDIAKDILDQSHIPYRIITSQINNGCYQQWLRGIESAQGDLVWIAEADDSADHRLLEKLIHFFEDKEVTLAYAQSEVIDQDSKRTGYTYHEYTNAISTTKWLNTYKQLGIVEIEEALIFQNTIPNASAVLMRKSALKDIRKHLESYQLTGDWLAYIYALTNGKIAYSPDTLNFHRRHDNSIIHKNVAKTEFYLELLNTLMFCKKTLTINSSALRSSLENISNIYINNFADVLKYPAMDTHPKLKKLVRQIVKDI